MAIKTKSYARIGLLGNPSDGFFGKTIFCLIKVSRQNNCPAKFCGSGGAVFGIINSILIN